jgi:cytidylate kinase
MEDDGQAGEPKGRIAIDGPAASGKSGVGSAVARALYFPFIDTGSIYRALTWLSIEQGIDLEDAPALIRLAGCVSIEIGPLPAEGDEVRITIDGIDATAFLRTDAVERNVSVVSAVPGVRAYLIQIQRTLAGNRAVMAGRDIGSVVLPDAELKVYLDASPEARARRRLEQLQGQGQRAVYNELVEQMRRRDYLDSTRAVAPLRIPDGAVQIVTDDLSLQAVIDGVLALWRERTAGTRDRESTNPMVPPFGRNAC